MDELRASQDDDPSNEKFFNNRCHLLLAYQEQRLFGLLVESTDEMESRQRGGRDDAIFMKFSGVHTSRMLPCFAVIEDREAEVKACDYVWTAKRARNKGIATYLLAELDIGVANGPLPEAVGFWEKFFAIDEMQ